MANPATVTKFPGRTILVVDDEEQVRTALTRLLEREGYTVTSAEGPTEGLEILRQQPIKLVISDHNMPDMSGIEFFRLIRERHPHVCRIMLTGDPERETIIRAVNEGEVYRFLPKPWNNTTIRVTVYFAFEAIQHHITDDGRDNAALWNPCRGWPQGAAINKASSEPLGEYALVHGNVLFQPRKGDVVKKAFDIPFQDPGGRGVLP